MFVFKNTYIVLWPTPNYGPHLVIILRPDVVDVPEILPDPVRGLVVPAPAGLFTLIKKAKNRPFIAGRTIHRVSAPPIAAAATGAESEGRLAVGTSWRRSEAWGGTSEAGRWATVVAPLLHCTSVTWGGATGVYLGRALLHRRPGREARARRCTRE